MMPSGEEIFPSNVFLSTSKSPAKNHHLLFLLTGNPGLLAYYLPFLYHIYSSLKSSSASLQDVSFDVAGRSLSGFEVERERGSPYSLVEQIDGLERTVIDIVGRERLKDSETKVILVGHSVGTYMLLEMLGRGRLKSAGVQVAAGICLFPTIMNLAGSPTGRKCAIVVRAPCFPYLAHYLVRLLTAVMPTFLLFILVKTVTKMPADAVKITMAFLKSPMGVLEALHMLRDELAAITIDKWGDSVWGSAAKPTNNAASTPKLFFYWGVDDHWVANETREQAIATRGRKRSAGEEWKPKMEVDTIGIPHDCVIRHSRAVADVVLAYVDEVVSMDLGRYDEDRMKV